MVQAKPPRPMVRGSPYQLPHVAHERTDRTFQDLTLLNTQFCKPDSLVGAAYAIVLEGSSVVGLDHPGDESLGLE